MGLQERAVVILVAALSAQPVVLATAHALLPEHQDASSPLLECARAILHTLPPGRTMSTPGTQLLPGILRWLHEQGTMALFEAYPPHLRHGDHSIPYHRVHHLIDNVVIQMESTKRTNIIDSYISIATNSSIWSPKANFIIFIKNPSTKAEVSAAVPKIAKILWRVFVLNFVTIVPEVNSSNVNFYTWFPFSKSSNCGKSYKSIVEIGKWMGGSPYPLFLRHKIFPQKVPNKLYDCNLTASTFKLKPFTFPKVNPKGETDLYERGIEIYLLQTIAKVSGFLIKYTPPPPNHKQLGLWGGQLANGSWVGILGNVVNKRADVAFAGFRMNEDYTSRLDFTSSYFKDTYVWLIQKPKKIPAWKSLILIFTWDIWLFLIVVYLVSSCVYWGLRRNEGGYKKEAELVFCTFRTWAIMLSVSQGYQPTTHRSRIFFFLWTFFSFLISVCYQSKFIGFLTNPAHLPQIRTVKELLQSGYKYGSVPYLRDLYDDNDPISKVIFKNFFACASLDKCFHRMVWEGKFSLLTTIKYAEYEAMRKFLDMKGHVLFMKLDDDVLSFDTSMYLRKGSPFTKRFGDLIERIRETALINKWWNDIRFETKIKNIINNKRVQEDGTIPINLLHLEGAFGLYCVGLFTSCLSLFAEITFRRQQRNNTKTKGFRRQNIRMIQLDKMLQK